MTLLEQIIEFRRKQEEALRKYLEELFAPPPLVPLTPVPPKPVSPPSPDLLAPGEQGSPLPLFDFPKELFRIHEESKRARQDAAAKQLEKAILEGHEDEFEDIDEEETDWDEDDETASFDYILDILNNFVQDYKDSEDTNSPIWSFIGHGCGSSILNPGLNGLNAVLLSAFGRTIAVHYDDAFFPTEFFEVTQP